MRKAFLITYELRNLMTHNYTPFFDEIKKIGPWWHYLPNVWLVLSADNGVSLQNKLNPRIVQSDHLLIIEIRRDSGGWLPRDAWSWINQNIPI